MQWCKNVSAKNWFRIREADELPSQSKVNLWSDWRWTLVSKGTCRNKRLWRSQRCTTTSLNCCWASCTWSQWIIPPLKCASMLIHRGGVSTPRGYPRKPYCLLRQQKRDHICHHLPLPNVPLNRTTVRRHCAFEVCCQPHAVLSVLPSSSTHVLHFMDNFTLHICRAYKGWNWKLRL